MEKIYEKTYQRKRFDALQALRAFCAIAVVIWHIKKIPVNILLGGWAVSVFFVLSGFLMAYNYCDRELPRGIKPQLMFSWSKIKKLYPLHIITLIYSSVILIIQEWGHFRIRRAIFNTFAFLTNITLTQSWIPSKRVYYSYNGVAWYLSVCVFLYFAFPFIMRKLKKLNKKMLFISAIGIYLTQLVLSVCVNMIPINIDFLDVSESFAHWFTYNLPLFRTGDFAIGCIFGYLYISDVNKNTDKIIENTQKKDIVKSTVVEIVVFVLLILSLLLSKLYFQHNSKLMDGLLNATILFLPTSVLLVYIFAKNRGLITKILTNKVTIYLGNISAYIFLLHQVSIQTLHIKENSLNGIEELLIVLTVTILLSEGYRRLSALIKPASKKNS